MWGSDWISYNLWFLVPNNAPGIGVAWEKENGEIWHECVNWDQHTFRYYLYIYIFSPTFTTCYLVVARQDKVSFWKSGARGIALRLNK